MGGQELRALQIIRMILVGDAYARQAPRYGISQEPHRIDVRRCSPVRMSNICRNNLAGWFMDPTVARENRLGHHAFELLLSTASDGCGYTPMVLVEWFKLRE